jgi:hypothetical protein
LTVPGSGSLLQPTATSANRTTVQLKRRKLFIPAPRKLTLRKMTKKYLTLRFLSLPEVFETPRPASLCQFERSGKIFLALDHRSGQHHELC